MAIMCNMRDDVERLRRLQEYRVAVADYGRHLERVFDALGRVEFELSATYALCDCVDNYNSCLLDCEAPITHREMAAVLEESGIRNYWRRRV